MLAFFLLSEGPVNKLDLDDFIPNCFGAFDFFLLRQVTVWGDNSTPEGCLIIVFILTCKLELPAEGPKAEMNQSLQNCKPGDNESLLVFFEPISYSANQGIGTSIPGGISTLSKCVCIKAY